MLVTINKDNPIAVFDSGVGGISVLRELVKIMPNENYIYFGDSANAPYGTKSLEEVRNLTCEHARRLFEEGAKGFVVACNTATSAAVRVLRETYPDIPIVGIEPAVKPAILSKENPRVLVMATPMTIKEEKLKKLMSLYEDKGELLPLPCPGLMDFVEKGDLESDDLRKYLKELLYEYIKEPVEAAVLGCTHYPFVKKMIQEVLGEKVVIFDGGEGTAKEMRRRLDVAELLSDRNVAGYVEFRNSSDDPRKIDLCKYLLNCEL